jgi:hypothetical protein
MYCKTTFKTLNSKALVTATTLLAAAWAGNAHADAQSDAVAVTGANQTQLTGTVDGNKRFDLTAYGDRYTLARKAIAENARKPCWGWDNSDDGAEDQVASSN